MAINIRDKFCEDFFPSYNGDTARAQLDAIVVAVLQEHDSALERRSLANQYSDATEREKAFWDKFGESDGCGLSAADWTERIIAIENVMDMARTIYWIE